MKLLAPAIALTALIAFWSLQPSFAQTKTMEVDLGTATVLTDDKGMTLYIFLRDAAGKSNCNDRCPEFWPPLMADAAASVAEKFSIITRDDGSKQWAYKDRPLYRFARDEKPGDAKGEGFIDAWLVARP